MRMDMSEPAIQARIRQHRTAAFRLRLVDAAGTPIPRARVHLRLLRHAFRLGANGFLINGGEDAGLRREYERAFAGLLNYATLPFYWGGYEATPGAENTDRLRAMAGWCQAHGVRTKGHPLAWHEVFPKWADALPDDEVLNRLRARITRIVRAFAGQIDVWDVFNETTVASRFDNAVGRWVAAQGAAACVAETLRLARAANPKAELLYNDFNVSPDMERLLEQLQADGAPFDAIGIQSHMHKAVWSDAKVWETCECYARFGLPLHFTELTILSGRRKADDDNDWHRRHTDWTSTPEGEAEQLAVGRQFYTLLFSHPAVEAVTWWDFSDRQAWQGAPAGLLRQDMSPKPLADWLRKAFGETWSTQVVAEADDQGVVALQGYFGEYAVCARATSGQCLAGTCDLPRRGGREVKVRLT